MKYTKVAAVVAGSVAALGAAGSAFAAPAPALPPMSLTGGVTETLNAAAPVTANLPQTVGNGLAEQGDAVNQAVGAVQDVNKVKNDAPGKVLNSANVVGKVAPMLGGVHLNGGNGGNG
ncbi:hypothetical protein [Streptomyces antimicrobicus]|uniref:Secreted protein n=1 Tax=Streptomyces antimicrobicus TaxID=2883108 RepID=A0ABS8BF62_9ACTN|nr:hypothetical protein [Streptomyces antimicrobicus]MCB5183267.1 hypothetical protein [Streptomyces antimicrobicus]